MPDISMCPGGACPRRVMCYRHTAKPSERQTWFSPDAVTSGGACSWFIRRLSVEITETTVELPKKRKRKPKTSE